MIRNGFNKKEDELSLVYTNASIYRMCGAEALEEYILRQKKRYVAHIIRSDNEAVTKRLTFNSDESHRPGRTNSLLKSVLHHETQAAARFFQDAINRKI